MREILEAIKTQQMVLCTLRSQVMRNRVENTITFLCELLAQNQEFRLNISFEQSKMLGYLNTNILMAIQGEEAQREQFATMSPVEGEAFYETVQMHVDAVAQLQYAKFELKTWVLARVKEFEDADSYWEVVNSQLEN